MRQNYWKKTQAYVNSRRTPTSYAYTRIRSCKRIGHQYEYTQSHQRRYAAMFFYAAIVLCASTRQNSKSDWVGLLGIVQIEDKQQNDAKCLQS